MIEQKLPEAVERWLAEDGENYQHLDLLVAPPDSSEVVAEHPEIEGSPLLANEFQFMAGFPGTRLAFYMMLRRNGESHRMAEMLAARRPPRGNTDDTFFSGMGTLLDSCDGDENKLHRLVLAARRQGYEPQAGDVYLPNLATELGDRNAFISRTDGRAKIRKVCEQRGWACEGAVNVEARQPERDPYDSSVPLGEDIVSKTAAMMTKQDPSLKKLPRGELRDRIISKHGQKK